MQIKLAGTIGLLGLSTMMLAGSATAKDGSGDRNCLRLPEIKDSTVIDDRTILFETRNRTYYENDLPHPCPDLKRNERFMYRVSLDQLCNLDIITVLEDWGFGYRAGASCGLGDFTAISSQQADALIASPKGEQKDAQ